MFKNFLKLRSVLPILALLFLLGILQVEGRKQRVSNGHVHTNSPRIYHLGVGVKVSNARANRGNDFIFIDGYDDGNGYQIICLERIIGMSYCPEVPNYAEATQLDKIDPQQFDPFKSYFQNDLIQSENVTSRVVDETGNCVTKSRVIYPQGGLTKESKWVLIVQHEQHKQGVLVSWCEKIELPCRHNLLYGYSRCKQRFVYKKFVVLVNGVMKEAMIKLPISCECALEADMAEIYIKSKVYSEFI
ncbi:uncharacterized protein LOC128856291 [Anastrepha ludens]|uniref:uncharacterized protein LOC128856291 n=1 Tax=Anastrepha ludens TaxID=28586 RepID=UPI0023AEBC38|nr:uncharacterized protein LOC128856291 [Anastrepha ludens]